MPTFEAIDVNAINDTADTARADTYDNDNGVRIGSIWEGTQSSHTGWRVFVYKLGKRTVQTKVMRPRRSGPETFPKDAFPRLFRLVRDVPTLDTEPRTCADCGELKLPDAFPLYRVPKGPKIGQRVRGFVCQKCANANKGEGIRRGHIERQKAKDAAQAAFFRPVLQGDEQGQATAPAVNGTTAAESTQPTQPTQVPAGNALLPIAPGAQQQQSLSAILLDLASYAEHLERPAGYIALVTALTPVFAAGNETVGVYVAPAALMAEVKTAYAAAFAEVSQPKEAGLTIAAPSTPPTPTASPLPPSTSATSPVPSAPPTPTPLPTPSSPASSSPPPPSPSPSTPTSPPALVEPW